MSEELDDMGEGVDGGYQLASRWLCDNGCDDAPKFCVRDVGRGGFETFRELGRSTSLSKEANQAIARMNAGLNLSVNLKKNY